MARTNRRVLATLALVATLAMAGGGAVHASTKQAESTMSSPAAASGGETFQFQAEVSRLMDIIVHSLYSNRDVFLRELISNSADALDKARFLALTDKEALADNPELEIRIKVDPDAGTLEIRDSGVGMTRDDLVNNLGTLARSGTSAFLDALSASAKNAKGGGSSDSLSLIGQFGVGFYSAFLVADRVQVISKTAGKDSQQWAWESAADGAFTVKKLDEEGLLEGRGTLVRLFLKDDAAEYKDQHKLRELVGRYSEFVGHPIFLHESKEESREVSIDEKDDEVDKKKDKKEKTGDDDEISDGDDEDDLDLDADADKSSKKTKTVKETVWSWSRLNDVKPIWLRAPSDVKDDEHLDFFRAVAKTGPSDSPVARAHFSAEGDVEFRALLYVPATTPFGFYENYYTMEPSVRLYVRRVFVSDSGVVKDIVPRYLGFLRGVVDSDSLPLSVSRETLQASPALKTIKKKVVRKVLDALKKMSDAEASAVAAVAERKKAAAAGGGSKKVGGLFGKKSTAAPTKEEASAIDAYSSLWSNYGRAIKLGLLEDKPNAGRLAKLLRFKTSAFPDQKHAANLTSLDAYVSRMKPGQKQIFYLTGEDASALARSPFAERLLEGGFEVLLLDDPVDEYMSQSLTEFDGLKLADASKDGLKLTSKDKDASSSSDSKDSSSSSGELLLDEKARKQRDKAVRRAFKPLTDWWASPEVLGPRAGVARVKVSPRLVKSPAVVVSSQHGWNANMERIMKAQALAANDAGARAAAMRGGRTLEVNPRHGLVRKLREMHAAAFVADGSQEGSSSSSEAALEALKKETAELARLVYDSALLESGFSPDDPVELAARVRSAAGRAFAKAGEDLEALADIELPKEELEEEKKKEKEEKEEKDKKDEL